MDVNNKIQQGDSVRYIGNEIYAPTMIVKDVELGLAVCIWYDEVERVFKEHQFPVEILKK